MKLVFELSLQRRLGGDQPSPEEGPRRTSLTPFGFYLLWKVVFDRDTHVHALIESWVSSISTDPTAWQLPVIYVSSTVLP